MRRMLGILAAIIVLAVIGYFVFQDEPEEVVIEEPVVEEPAIVTTEVGRSVENRPIEQTVYGNGDTNVLFIGGIHGGYEWNSVLLAYEFMDYMEANLESIPEDVSVVIIPDLNPDGTFNVVQKEGRFALEDVPNPSERIGEGRFNANGICLLYTSPSPRDV